MKDNELENQELEEIDIQDKESNGKETRSKSKRQRNKKQDTESNNDTKESPSQLARKEFDHALQLAVPSRKRKNDLDYEIVIKYHNNIYR